MGLPSRIAFNSTTVSNNLYFLSGTIIFLKIYLVGQIFNNMVVPDSKYKFFESVVELNDFLGSNPIKGYYIFIKGSHSVQLDKVVEFL